MSEKKPESKRRAERGQGRRDGIEEAAAEAVQAILGDMTDRRGLGQEWDQIDPDIQVEIKAEWRRLLKPILERLAQKGAGRG